MPEKSLYVKNLEGTVPSTVPQVYLHPLSSIPEMESLPKDILPKIHAMLIRSNLATATIPEPSQAGNARPAIGNHSSILFRRNLKSPGVDSPRVEAARFGPPKKTVITGLVIEWGLL